MVMPDEDLDSSSRASFIQGVGYAVARLVEGHDRPEIGFDIIKDSGYALGDFMEVCDEHDIPFIKKAWMGRG